MFFHLCKVDIARNDYLNSNSYEFLRVIRIRLFDMEGNDLQKIKKWICSYTYLSFSTASSIAVSRHWLRLMIWSVRCCIKAFSSNLSVFCLSIVSRLIESLFDDEINWFRGSGFAFLFGETFSYSERTGSLTLDELPSVLIHGIIQKC